MLFVCLFPHIIYDNKANVYLWIFLKCYNHCISYIIFKLQNKYGLKNINNIILILVILVLRFIRQYNLKKIKKS